MKAIAEEVGVSVSTVSRALNNLPVISHETRELIVNAANRRGYIRNNVARGLALKTSYLIGVMGANIANPFFSSIASGVNELGSQNSFVVAFCDTQRSAEKEEAYALTFLENQVAGLIFVGGTIGESHLKRLRAHGVPFVVAGRVTKGLDAPTVAVDNVAAGYQATRHLVQRGHKRILFLSGSRDSATSLDREQGYQEAIRASGLSPQVLEGDFKLERGFEVASTLATRKVRPTAVFAANDMMAIGLIMGLMNHGLTVPDDVAVVGCDDIPLSGSIRPSLTTVRIPLYEIGRRSMAILISILQGEGNAMEHTVLLGCDLVVRKSSG